MRGCDGHLTIRVSGVDNTELDSGQLWGLSVVSTISKKDGGVTSWRHTVVTLMTMGLNGLKNRPWWGEKRQKLSVQRCYVRDSNKQKRSKKLRSILGSPPCSILRIWRLWARTKNEYTLDDFSMLTIREPWLLKRISTSNASTSLAGGDLMLQGLRDSRRGTNLTEISQKTITKKKEGY
jgi:hypothetical protein